MKISIRLLAILSVLCFRAIEAEWTKPNWIETDFRLGFGPAWVSELGDTRYTFTGSEAQGINQNKFPFNVGPWIDGSINAELCKYIVVDFYGGGGWIRKGYGEIIQKTLISSLSGLPTNSDYHEYDTDITCNFLTTFAGAGVCYNHNECYFMSLTAGYAFNKQLWHTVQLTVPYTHYINNKWKSPYVGIGAKWNISDYLKFGVNYRALIGHIISTDKIMLHGTTIGNFCRSVPRFFGNLISLNCAYQFANCWNTDICFLYNTFQNFKKGCVTPSTTATTKNAYFNRLRFNMFAFTLALGYTY